MTVQFQATVDGGSGNDYIHVTTKVNTANADDASVVGASGDDTIFVFAEDNLTVDGGTGDDVIDVTADNNEGSVGDGTVFGGDGNDVITVRTNFDGALNATDPNYYIRAGQGNDVINLQGFAGDANNNGVQDAGETINGNIFEGGQDTVVFENVTYNAGQQVTNENGRDVINNFNFEAAGGDPSPTREDVLDFSAFLGHTVGGTVFGGTTDYNGAGAGNGTALAVKYFDWTAGLTTETMDNSTFLSVPTWDDRDADIAVVAVSNNNFVLTSANFSEQTTNFGGGVANTISIDDNGKAVVIIAKDMDGTLGYDTFDVYFVQDVDSDAGAAWAVDKVATINSLTDIGWNFSTSIGANTFA